MYAPLTASARGYAVVSIVLECLVATSAYGSIEVLLSRGDVLPNGSQIDVLSRSSGLTDAGEFAVYVEFAGEPDTTLGLVAVSSSGPEELFRTNDYLPDIDATIPDRYFRIPQVHATPGGEFVVGTPLNESALGSATDHAILAASRSGVRILARTGDFPTGAFGPLVAPQNPVVDRSGDIYFRDLLSDCTTGCGFVESEPVSISGVIAGQLVDVVHSGVPIESGPDLFGARQNRTASAGGASVIYSSVREDGSPFGLGEGLFVVGRQGNRDLARRGELVPGVGRVDRFPNFSNGWSISGINDSGDVLFSIDRASGTDNDYAVVLASGSATEVIADQNTLAPDGNGILEDLFSGISNGSEFYFRAGYRDTTGGDRDDTALLAFDSTTQKFRTLLREGDQLPGGGVASTWIYTPEFAVSAFGGAVVNRSGQFAMLLLIDEDADGQWDTRGVFSYREGVLTEVARVGQVIDGHELTTLYTGMSINASGQVLFQGELSGLGQSFLVWTIPEPMSLYFVVSACGLLSVRRRQ